MYRGLGMEEGTAKTAAQYGVPTAATGAFSQFVAEQTGWDVATRGWDVGSGLRFQPMLAGLAEGKELSPLDAMAVAKWWIETAESVATINKTQAEERRDMMRFAPFVGSKFLMDRYGQPEGFGAGQRAMVPQVSKTGVESGSVRQSPAEEVGTLLGSSTVEKKEAGQRKFVNTQLEQKRIQTLTRDIQKFSDMRRSKKEPPEMLKNRIIKNFAEMGTEPDAVVEKIVNEQIRRGMTTEQTVALGPDLQMSLREAIRYSNYRRGLPE
jgi:hypothetical protein